MENDIMVSVLCTAYNHEKFIKDAIEGVISQQTNFRYELIIHDDASGDKTSEKIKEYEKKYPEKIYAIIQTENQFQERNIYDSFLFPIAKGRYIAFCEGDDYWTDENKLQIQVDFLEAHKNYSMCMHNAVKKNYETGEEDLLNTFPGDGTYPQEKQVLIGLGTDFPAFASYMIRAELLKDIPDFFLLSKVVDYPLRQYYANCGEVYYFEKPMSVYRMSTPQSFMRKTSENQLFYNDYTLEMISFFEKFNQYTKNKYNDILSCKINSDYLGFCVSLPPQKGMAKALEKGLDIDRVRKCYRCLTPEHLEKNIFQTYIEANYIFIYGTGKVAMICRKHLEFLGFEFEGFVVSDGQRKAEHIGDKRVYCLSEVISDYQNPGFILAMQPVNAAMVIAILRQNGIKNICMPYMVK